jgi:hypothetical protein
MNLLRLENLQSLLLPFLHVRFAKILTEKEYWAFVSQMAEIIQPEGVDMFQMDLEHIHAVLRNRSYDMESLMKRVSATCGTCPWHVQVNTKKSPAHSVYSGRL